MKNFKQTDQINHSIEMEELRIKTGEERIERNITDAKKYDSIGTISSIMAEAKRTEASNEEARVRIKTLEALEGKSEVEIQENYKAEEMRYDLETYDLEGKIEEIKLYDDAEEIIKITEEAEEIETKIEEISQRLTILAWALREE